MMRFSTRGRSAGFTLVELLVAVTLIALLTSLLFGGFRIGTRAARAIGTRIATPADIALVYDFMTGTLTDAEPLPVATRPDAAANTGSTPIVFDGEPQAMSVVTLPPAYLAIGGFHLLHIGLEPGNAGQRLIVSWTSLPRGPVAPEPTALQPSILIDKVQSIAFAYYGEPAPKQEPAWLDRWADRDSLPQLIRLRLALSDGTVAPDLVVAPRLAATLKNE
jgi:general secretion pathway protein J